jgi:hypothetical protein
MCPLVETVFCCAQAAGTGFNFLRRCRTTFHKCAKECTIGKAEEIIYVLINWHYANFTAIFLSNFVPQHNEFENNRKRKSIIKYW